MSERRRPIRSTAAVRRQRREHKRRLDAMRADGMCCGTCAFIRPGPAPGWPDTKVSWCERRFPDAPRFVTPERVCLMWEEADA